MELFAEAGHKRLLNLNLVAQSVMTFAFMISACVVAKTASELTLMGERKGERQHLRRTWSIRDAQSLVEMHNDGTLTVCPKPSRRWGAILEPNLLVVLSTHSQPKNR